MRGVIVALGVAVCVLTVAHLIVLTTLVETHDAATDDDDVECSPRFGADRCMEYVVQEGHCVLVYNAALCRDNAASLSLTLANTTAASACVDESDAAMFAEAFAQQVNVLLDVPLASIGVLAAACNV